MIIKKIKNIFLYFIFLILKIIGTFGIKIKNPIIVLKNIFLYIKNIIEYIYKYKNSKNVLVQKFPINFKSLVPMLDDLNQESGNTNGVYFIQDIWAAQRIYKKKPNEHIDIGSESMVLLVI